MERPLLCRNSALILAAVVPLISLPLVWHTSGRHIMSPIWSIVGNYFNIPNNTNPEWEPIVSVSGHGYFDYTCLLYHYVKNRQKAVGKLHKKPRRQKLLSEPAQKKVLYFVGRKKIVSWKITDSEHSRECTWLPFIGRFVWKNRL